MAASVFHGGEGGEIEPDHDPRQVPPGQERPIRAKDSIAPELSGLEGAPQFELDWPEADKNEDVAEISAFLRDRLSNGTRISQDGNDHAFPAVSFRFVSANSAPTAP